MPDSSNQHSVPAVASAFVFQIERALYHLSNARLDCVVGVETDDDVAVRRGSVLQVSEQDKISTRSTGHPFQDRSTGLWQTLLIWLTGHDGGLAVERYCAVTSRPVPEASLISRMASATTDTAADACIADLRHVAATASDDLKAITDRVCAFPERALRNVILRFELQDGTTGGQREDSKSATIDAIGVPVGVAPVAVYEQLLGWLADVLQQKWLNRQPGWVERQSYVNERQRIVNGLQRERVLERARQLVPVAVEQRQAARSREFVGRLIEIDVNAQVINDAIEDLLKFETEFIRLLQEGEVQSGDWDAMFDDMERRWRGIARRVVRTSSTAPDVVIGQELLDNTIDPDFRPILRDMRTTHGYFAAGGYHRLADDLRVGWHPRHLS